MLSHVRMIRNKIKPGQQGEISKITDRMDNGYSKKYGFLHIPKTGGSSIEVFGRELVKLGHPFPCPFPHFWRAPEILDAFPRMKLIFVVRDPLERAISGFNSRLRQGRPTYDIIWTNVEATAFAHFPSAKHFLQALLNEDEYSRSAAIYATRAISHLNWNYIFYFRDIDFIRNNSGRFQLIGDINKMDNFISTITGLAGAPPKIAEKLYSKRHEAGIRPAKVLEGYSEEEIAKIRSFFAKEYEIYDALRALAEARCTF